MINQNFSGKREKFYTLKFCMLVFDNKSRLTKSIELKWFYYSWMQTTGLCQISRKFKIHVLFVL